MRSRRPLSRRVGRLKDVRDDNDDSSTPLRLRWITHLGRTVVKHTVTRLAIAVIPLLLATTFTADAQSPGKVYRIGYIQTAAPN